MDILQLQQILKQLHLLRGNMSGELDFPTRMALRHFQRAHGLKLTNELDEVTIEKLNEVMKNGEDGMNHRMPRRNFERMSRRERHFRHRMKKEQVAPVEEVQVVTEEKEEVQEG